MKSSTLEKKSYKANPEKQEANIIVWPMPRLIFCVRALIQLTYAKVDIIVFEAHQARITEAQHVNLNKISIFYQKEKKNKISINNISYTSLINYEKAVQKYLNHTAIFVIFILLWLKSVRVWLVFSGVKWWNKSEKGR